MEATLEKENTNTFTLGIDDAIRLADEKYVSMLKNGEYKKLLDGIAQMPHLTVRNLMLVKEQMPESTNVKNMEAWNFSKRYIKEGEHALKILKPVYEERIVTHSNGEVTREKTNEIFGYKYGFVFDESQTEGRELRPKLVTEENAEKLYGYFKERVLQELFCDWEIKEVPSGLDYAVLNDVAGKVYINKKLKYPQKIQALASQCATYLNSYDLFYRRLTKTNYSSYGDSATAYIVAKSIGVPYQEVPDPSKSVLHEKREQLFQANLNAIRKNANRVLVMYNEAFRDYENEMYQEKVKQVKDRYIEKEEPKMVINYPEKSKEYELEGVS